MLYLCRLLFGVASLLRVSAKGSERSTGIQEVGGWFPRSCDCTTLPGLTSIQGSSGATVSGPVYFSRLDGISYRVLHRTRCPQGESNCTGVTVLSTSFASVADIHLPLLGSTTLALGAATIKAWRALAADILKQKSTASRARCTFYEEMLLRPMIGCAPFPVLGPRARWA